MLRRNNKKGFTLAELLIVVAIIAVLVAIAVPVFVGALTKAENGVIEANKRTMKGLVVAEILTNDDLLYYTDKDSSTQKNCTEWYAKGTYDAKKDEWTINKTDIKAKEKLEGENPYAGKESSKSGDTYTLYITITYTDLT